MSRRRYIGIPILAAVAICVSAVLIVKYSWRPRGLDQLLPHDIQSIDFRQGQRVFELDAERVNGILSRTLARGKRTVAFKKGLIGGVIRVRSPKATREFDLFFHPQWLRVRSQDTSFLLRFDAEDHAELVAHLKEKGARVLDE